MASQPEKRVASSVFITLAPPRRDEAVAEEVRRAACEARPGRPWESAAPTKAPGAGSAGRPSPWTPPGRAAATGPAAPSQLPNGGKTVRPGLEGDPVRGALGWGRGRALRWIIHLFIYSSSTYYVPGRL